MELLIDVLLRSVSLSRKFTGEPTKVEHLNSATIVTISPSEGECVRFSSYQYGLDVLPALAETATTSTSFACACTTSP